MTFNFGRILTAGETRKEKVLINMLLDRRITKFLVLLTTVIKLCLLRWIDLIRDPTNSFYKLEQF